MMEKATTKNNRPTRCFFCGELVFEQDNMVYGSVDGQALITFHDLCGIKFSYDLLHDSLRVSDKLNQN